MTYGNTPQDQANRRRWLAENLDRIQTECLDMRKDLGRMPFLALLAMPDNIAIMGGKEKAIYAIRKAHYLPEAVIDELIRIPLDEDDTFIVVVASNGFMRTTLNAQLAKRDVEGKGVRVILYNAADFLPDSGNDREIDPTAGSGGVLM